MSALHLVGESLLAAFQMFWSIFWALVLGFMISGVIQAFVSKRKMTFLLGGSGVRELSLATFFGAASSSCSYAAASMSKSLFQKGAHIIPALAFMLASTNLVLELSIILWIMMGWQFVLAEFIGGILLVAIMWVFMRFFGPLPAFEAKRLEMNQSSSHSSEHESHGMTDGNELTARPTTLEGWRKAAQAFEMEWKMIWKDIALGMMISGFLMVLVPDSFWQAIFLHSGQEGQDGVLKLVENVMVGPIVSVVSFVCSVGNIPLASVLYHGGIGFGGALSFIYADLIIIPLILIYRKYYGWKLALWITGIFYVSMALAGVLVDLLFHALRIVPSPETVAPMGHMHGLELNYTFWLNIIFFLLGAGFTWLARTGEKSDESHCCHHD